MGHSTGILGRIKNNLERNRLGEVLVMRGRLSPLQLKAALSSQHEQRMPLGKILIQHGYVTRSDIASAIATQWALRSLATVVTVMIAASAFQVKTAHAKDAQNISFSSAPISSIASYPDLFGSSEKKSSDLSAFTKWGTMFARFDGQMKKPGSAETLKKWKSDLEAMRGLPLETMVHRVNAMANKVPYINDNKNWGKSDYWATPVEFFTRGGDCEDFAIAKYASLRALGVPDNRMRIAIVKDLQKNIPHAILIVYTDNGPVVLDNQIKTVKAQSDIAHYKPIFSINRSSWWLHTPNRGTLVASR